MKKKSIFIKEAALLLIATAVMISSLTGCKSDVAEDLVGKIDQGQSIVVEALAPTTYKASVQGERNNDTYKWVQTDKLKTYNMGFRQGVDELLNINIISEDNGELVGGKQGSIYVGIKDGKEVRNGNNSLYDAFRNKVFIEKYWSDKEFKTELRILTADIYEDVDENSSYALEATLNAYFNVAMDSKNPTKFDATQVLTREEFYALLFRATHGVQDLGDSEDFATSVGGETEYTQYVKQVADKGFLTVDNKGLTAESIKTPISRVEAIYALVQLKFPELYNQTTEDAAAYADTKNAGDLALKVGFKTKGESGVVEKDLWQSYTLQYMFTRPEMGMQSELYRAMAVAKQLGLIGGNNSRWNEQISKSEAIGLVAAAAMAENRLMGFATTVEYGEIDAVKPKEELKNKWDELPTQEDATEFDKNLEYTLDNLDEWQIKQFEEVSNFRIEEVMSGEITVEELDTWQDSIINTYVVQELLPINSISLFREWKEVTEFYIQFADLVIAVEDGTETDKSTDEIVDESEGDKENEADGEIAK